MDISSQAVSDVSAVVTVIKEQETASVSIWNHKIIEPRSVEDPTNFPNAQCFLTILIIGSSIQQFWVMLEVVQNVTSRSRFKKMKAVMFGDSSCVYTQIQFQLIFPRDDRTCLRIALSKQKWDRSLVSSLHDCTI